LQQATVEHFVGSEGGIGTRDGRGRDARFNQPRGIWSDGTFAYVADMHNAAIRRISVGTADVATVAGIAQRPQPGVIASPYLLWGNGAFLYFVDGVVVRRLSLPTGEISLVAGSTGGVTDGVGAQAQFRGPLAITGNSTHLYILESAAYTSRNLLWASPALIRRISLSSGEVSTLPLTHIAAGAIGPDFDPGGLWADDQFLYLTFLSRPGAVTLGRMSLDNFEFTPLMGFPIFRGESRYLPRLLWSDGAGDLFFVDGAKISRVVLSTGEVSHIASAPPAFANGIGGIFGSGNTLVATDTSASVVFVVNTLTKEVKTLAGRAYLAPSADEDIRPMKGAGPLWRQGESFYVADRNHSVIHRIAAGTGQLSTFVSNIPSPAGMWGDERFLYVTQSSTGIVSRISLETAAVTTLSSEFVTPTTIAGDSQYLYVVDRDYILRISKLNGALVPFARDLSVAGFRGIFGMWTDGLTMHVMDNIAIRKIDLATLDVTVLALASAFSAGPSALWSDGRIVYIGVTGGIQQFDPVTREVRTIMGGLMSTGFQDGPPGVARMGIPKGIWSDAQHIYFVDDSLRRFNLATQEVTTFAGRALRLSQGLIPSEMFGVNSITGGDGFLYATSGYAVYKISLTTREITHIAGAFNESGTKDGIGNAARFLNPRSIFNLGRYLFVVDTIGLRRVDVETGAVTTFAGLPEFIRGVWANGTHLYFTALVFNSTSPGLYRIDLSTREVIPFVSGLPEAGALWGDGANLYVTGSNRTIRKVNLATREVSVLAGDPTITPGAIHDGTGTDAHFASPNSIWGDGRLLYVTDRSTVRTVHPATGETHTIAGDAGTYGTENGFGIGAHFTFAMDGIWGDGEYIYIGDRAIRRLTLSGRPMNAISFAVRSGGGDYWRSSATDEPLQIAYGRLQPGFGSAPPDGVVVFSFRSQGVLVSEASVPASPLIQSGRVFSETNEVVRTGIAIANPNDVPATVSFYFTDAAGANVGSGAATISANQQIAAFLNEAPFNGTAAARSFTFTASVPVTAITLRGYVNERSDFLMTTLPVAPVSSNAGSEVVLPHYASGGGWTTQTLLVNPTDTTIAGTVEMDTTTSYSIPPRSAAKIVSSTSGPEIRTGFVRVTPSPGSRSPVASSVFSFVTNGVTVTETGITSAETAQSFRVFAEFNSAHTLRTGVAVANTSGSSTDVRFDLLNLEGQPTGLTGAATIAANGHLALFLNELPGFRDLPSSFRGVLSVSAGAPISVIGLRGRYNERGDFLVATTPAIAETAAVPGELVFPHIVTGGGYTTEFLLLSRGGTASGSVSLRSQPGADLSLPIIK